MLEVLQDIDAQWLLTINGWHTPYLDNFMWLVSKMASWILIAIVTIVLNSRLGWRRALVLLVSLGVAIALADFVSSGIIKHAVERLRPTHDPSLQSLVHIVHDYRGGQFGFVSSHAANSFAVALLLGLAMPGWTVMVSLMAWACLQCYSRMYLGVHYPGDIVGGMIVGLAAGYIGYQVWRWGASHICGYDGHERLNTTTISLSVVATILTIAVVAMI